MTSIMVDRMTGIETLRRGPLMVEIRPDMNYFTVWNCEKPVATITRPRVYTKQKWSVHATDGSLIRETTGPRTAFNAAYHHWHLTNNGGE